METPWELEAENAVSVDGKYKTDNGNDPIFLGGDGIPSKKVTGLNEKWKIMENLCTQGLVKVPFYL